MWYLHFSFKRLFHFMNTQLMKRKSESVWEKWRTQVADLIHLFFQNTFSIMQYRICQCSRYIFHSFTIIFSTLHFEKSSNMAKIWQKMKKSLVRLAFNPFLQYAYVYCTYPKPRFFCVPVPPLAMHSFSFKGKWTMFF